VQGGGGQQLHLKPFARIILNSTEAASTRTTQCEVMRKNYTESIYKDIFLLLFSFCTRRQYRSNADVITSLKHGFMPSLIGDGITVEE
jgi:hypothetical protein